MKYRIRISDYKKTLRFGLYISVLFLIALISIAFYAGNSPKEEQGVIFGLGFGIAFGVTLILMLIILFGILGKNDSVVITENQMLSDSGVKIDLKEITKISADWNRNGYNSLIILYLSDGRKVSITPTNKFGRNAMAQYNGFLKSLTKVIPKN